MINIAIVENEKEAVERLELCLENYADENKVSFNKSVFYNGNDFLFDYKPIYDIVFMDVDMPEISGFKTAKKLRELDKNVMLVFVTNLSRYAIRGYEYDASDYIVKPLTYAYFSLKLKRLLSQCNKKRGLKFFWIDEDTFVDVSEIYYVEIKKHSILYHTSKGNLEGYGTLKKVEEGLPAEMFYRCNSCYLVNLNYVESIEGYNVKVKDDILVISHPKKKAFIEALHHFCV